jgi:uncharacterized protein DUF3800
VSDQEKDDDTPGDLFQPADAAAEKAAAIETERQTVLASLAAARPSTLVERVAWVLNNFPETRNSDVALQIRYWRLFVPTFRGESIALADLFTLPRLTSLSRARARVQNTLKLFLADPDVRKHRGTLSEEEREEAALAKTVSAPVYSVYADESGKTQEFLLVGSLWLLQGPDAFPISQRLLEWREVSDFEDELHFVGVDDRRLPFYKAAVDLVINNASALSLKFIAVRRRGAGTVSDVVARLLYHLVVRGIEHENDSGRAPLPRTLQLWKDAEDESSDRLVLADLKDRLKNAAAGQFGGRLVVDVVEAANSKGNDLLQVADLFVASINRVINPPDPPPKTPSAKDILAQHVLARTGVSLAEATEDSFEDLAVRMGL